MSNELTQKMRSKPVSTFFNEQAARSCYGALLGIEILESRNKLSSIKVQPGYNKSVDWSVFSAVVKSRG